MAKKSEPVIEVKNLDDVNDLMGLLNSAVVGQTIELKHHRSKQIAATIRAAGVTLPAPVDKVRTFTIDGATFQWTNVTFAAAAKAGDQGKANRTIVRTA